MSMSMPISLRETSSANAILLSIAATRLTEGRVAGCLSDCERAIKPPY